MAVLYYIPGLQIVSPAELRASGLAHLADAGYEQRGVMKGPDGGAGVVLGAAVDALQIGYYAERQTWVELVSAACWLGWGTDTPPGPADFVRPKPLPGHWVELGDGRQWLIPVAVMIDRETSPPRPACALPWASAYVGGSWQRRCQPRYQPLLALAMRVLERCAKVDGDGVVVLTGDGAEDEAVQALEANYRLGAGEASALGLLTDDAIVNVLLALIDGPSWGAEKKTARAGGRTAPGDEDC